MLGDFLNTKTFAFPERELKLNGRAERPIYASTFGSHVKLSVVGVHNEATKVTLTAFSKTKLTVLSFAKEFVFANGTDIEQTFNTTIGPTNLGERVASFPSGATDQNCLSMLTMVGGHIQRQTSQPHKQSKEAASRRARFLIANVA